VKASANPLSIELLMQPASNNIQITSTTSIKKNKHDLSAQQGHLFLQAEYAKYGRVITHKKTLKQAENNQNLSLVPTELSMIQINENVKK